MNTPLATLWMCRHSDHVPVAVLQSNRRLSLSGYYWCYIQYIKFILLSRFWHLKYKFILSSSCQSYLQVILFGTLRIKTSLNVIK